MEMPGAVASGSIASAQMEMPGAERRERRRESGAEAHRSDPRRALLARPQAR